MSDMHPKAREVDDLVQAIGALLYGKTPEVQGAALADLLAIYLVGYRVPELRDEVFQMHIEAVRELIPVNEKLLMGEP